MFHEPYVEFAWSPIRRNAIAIVQRGMARTLLDAATQTYVSTDAWRRYLAPYMPASRQPIVTLPIPSAIPKCDRSNDVATRRGALTRSPRGRLIGHFGTYGSHIAPLLRPALMALLSEEADATAVCTGAGSEGFARSVVAARPSLEGRVHATGRAPADEIATVLCACDLLVQPYPDGVTTRRTSVMAGLINARAVLTTTGHLTESVWSETNAVALTDAGHTEALVRSARDLLADDESRAALAARGEKTYRERFDLMHTIQTLRGAVEGAAA
jgi:glycosyltransferase involved in cell wall biosynthesis